MLAAPAAAVPLWRSAWGMQSWVTNVHSRDADKTIDGEQPRAEPEPTAIAPPGAAVYDYGGLITVERHHYLVSREIAKGGMGRVLAARDLRLGREVAIKELLPRSRDAAKRFEREALITARLQHPSIIHIYEAGIWPGGEPFYAMPHVSGRSLDKVVAECVTIDERLGLVANVISVADALAYAHSENVIHRDLKPANVLVGQYGETVVIDWGLAKDLERLADPAESLQMRARAAVGETMSGSVVGTPAYMPPEQARGEAVDQRSDVYAIGALLYKVLVGHAPYESDSSAQLIELVKTRAPIPISEREPGVPRDLIAIVEKAMAREPGDRYSTAVALAQDLKRFQTGQLVGAHHYTRSQLVLRFIKQHRVALAISIAAVTALTIVGVVSVRSIVKERETARAAQAKAEIGRIELLVEQGRSELLAGHSGAALGYLIAAAQDGTRGGPRGFLLADAKRPFQAGLPAFTGSTAIAVSPDGLHLCSAGPGLVEIRTTDGKLVRQFPEGPTIRVVAFDGSGSKIIAAGDDGVARIWSVAGTEISTLHGHVGSVTDAAFSPDGRHVVTGGEDSTVRVWDVSSGTLVGTSTCHSQPVTSVRFSPDGARVASASNDHTGCVSAITGGVLTQLRGHKQRVNSVRWTGDGAFILTASDDGNAYIWSAGGNNPTAENQDAGGGKRVVAALRHERGASIDVAELSPDGTRVLTAGDDHVARVWELPELALDRGTPSARLVYTLVGHADKIVAATFSSDGLRIATAGYDHRATVWDATNGQAIATFENSDIVGAVAFADGGARLVTGSRDRTVRIWNIAEGVAKIADESLESEIHAIAVAADGTLAVATDNSRVTLRNGATRSVLKRHMGRVLALAVSSSERAGSSLLVTGGEDEQAIVWKIADGKGQYQGTLGDPGVPNGPVMKTRSIAVAPDGDTIAILKDRNHEGIVQLWSAATRKKVIVSPQLIANAEIDMIAYSSQGFLAGGGSHGALVLWDPKHGTRPIVSLPQHGPVTSLAFSDDGDYLVAAGQGELRIYRLINIVPAGMMVPVFVNKIDGLTGEVRAVLFKDHASLLITASDDGVAKVWDARSGKLLAVRDPHGRPLTSLALADHEQRLWIASEDGTLGEWDVAVDTSTNDSLAAFVTRHVPWTLQGDDAMQRVEGGAGGKH